MYERKRHVRQITGYKDSILIVICVAQLMDDKRKSHIDYAAVHDDFPRPVGEDPQGTYWAWEISEIFADYVAKQAAVEKARHSLIPIEEILEMYCESELKAGNGGSKEETEWVFRRVAEILGCDLPECFRNSTRR